MPDNYERGVVCSTEASEADRQHDLEGPSPMRSLHRNRTRSTSKTAETRHQKRNRTRQISNARRAMGNLPSPAPTSPKTLKNRRKPRSGGRILAFGPHKWVTLVSLLAIQRFQIVRKIVPQSGSHDWVTNGLCADCFCEGRLAKDAPSTVVSGKWPLPQRLPP
jgi:hypothetical protein